MAGRRLALRTVDATWLDYILYARIHPVIVSLPRRNLEK